MPLFNSQNQNARSGRQLVIVAMALLQLLVLLPLGLRSFVIWNGHQTLLGPNLRERSRRCLITSVQRTFNSESGRYEANRLQPERLS
jgi:hypothetical protein